MAISCFTFTGSSIKCAADNEIQRIKNSLGSSFKLKADLNNECLYEESDQGREEVSDFVFAGPIVTNEIIEQILSVEHVTDSFMNIDSSAWTNLELRAGAWMNDLEDEEYKEHPEYWESSVVSKEETELYTHNVTIFPCTDGELHDYFKIGACEIIKGRNIKKNDVDKAVISARLAERNHLNVGDLFHFETKEGFIKPHSNEPFRTIGSPIEVEIVGLFDVNFEQEYSVYTLESDFVENMIFTDVGINQKIRKNYGEGKQKGVDNVTFFVDNPENLDSVMQKVSEMESIKGLIIEQDDGAYRVSVKPLKQISRISLVLFIAGIVGCLILLYLVLKLWTKSRKKEVGILKALGFSKKEILLQFLMETMLLAVIGLILGLILSIGIREKSFLMVENMTASKENTQAYEVESEKIGWVPEINKSVSEKVALDAAVSSEIVLFTILMIIGSAVVSVLLAGKKILSIKSKELL